jgi:hypothetical protein
MMEDPQIPQDDLMDVLEMTRDIEAHISRVLAENDLNLALSALMSAFINIMLAQCDTLDEVIFYRNLFMQMLDSSIITIRIEGRKKPPSSS